ncbi:hypothetical protein Ngar_c19690 [Candidatus Nitrososphaera gargensis Ga9.2]|uniref:Uncharacterized protein n=1 Tax=Nitrososphaera gargensis (strain Ga9.2) TaxID=1237085 RepID=K0IC26_NITGG|nr:hypothetical protein [Candidatus Nitrososphaera gargensis]AFU58901.1 hypothetical protein Ngar_c19690 [Candidatus Nitrososphaera gargensis Ga9.2]
MFCCAGLFGGFIAGAATGILWVPFVTAAAGAGGGLLIDIKMFRALNKKNDSKESHLGRMCCDALRLSKKKRSNLRPLKLPQQLCTKIVTMLI